MIKLIKRTTDNKFLQSLSADTWVDTAKEAFEMTYFECQDTKTELLKTYQPEQLKEIVNMRKGKPITDEEISQLSALRPRKSGLPKSQFMVTNNRVSKKEEYLKSLDISKIFKK